MKTLIFNTDEISFKVGPESDRPTGIKPLSSSDDHKEFKKVAVAFLCIECEDTTDEATTIADELLKYSKMVGRNILLIPFVHLTSRPADPEKAIWMLKFVAKLLRDDGKLEGTGGFGFHKALIAKWATLTHKGGDVAYRDSKFIKVEV